MMIFKILQTKHLIISTIQKYEYEIQEIDDYTMFKNPKTGKIRLVVDTENIYNISDILN